MKGGSGFQRVPIKWAERLYKKLHGEEEARYLMNNNFQSFICRHPGADNYTRIKDL